MKFKYQQPTQGYRQKPTMSQPISGGPVPSTGGGTPVPIQYTETAIDPMYDTPINSTMNLGGNTYTQTGGLLSLLESAEAAREVQQQIEIQRAVQKSLQDENPPAPQVDNTQMVVFLLMGLLVGYLAYPIIKQWTN